MNKYFNDRGSLLIGVLIAIVILSVALLSISSLFIQSTKATSSSSHYTTAANLAQKQLELLKNKPTSYWNSLDLAKNIAWQDTSIDPTKMQPSYTIVTTPSQCTELNATNLVTVQVTVSWVERGQNLQVIQTTFFSKI